MARLSFFGAAQEVTGSCFLLETDGKKILIDCGLFQSPRFSNTKNTEPFPFDAKSIDALFVTHAHIDHTGRIPKLIKAGFKGKIFSTLPTKDLANLMLKDSVGVLTKEAEREKEEILYVEEDVDRAMSAWEGKKYHDTVNVGDASFAFYDAGHVLGSAMIFIECLGESGAKIKILFTGDLGNPTNPLLLGISKSPSPDYLRTEATYGDSEQ